MQVYVLLFNAQTENEGIHTLKVDDRNVVLMFESEDDATRYGLMLEAQDFSSPTIEGFDSEEIEEFCVGADYECRLVPEGMLAVPPETNLDQTDWTVEGKPTDQPTDQPSAGTEPAPDFSTYELDQIRRRLEGLL
jgi:Protein of unknown function (DUF3110)